MRRSISMLLASASIAVLSLTAANAADLPVKYVPPAPMFSWSGFYLGAHIGGTWGTTESEINSIAVPGLFAIGGITLPVVSHAFNGFVGGGQIGYNWQSGIVVFGVEGELSATNAKGTGALPRRAVLQDRSELDGNRSRPPRPRRWPQPLLRQGRCGLVAQHLQRRPEPDHRHCRAEVSDTRWGWLVGAGIEHAFAGTGLSAKLEYDFVDYGSKDYNLPLAFIVPIDIGTKIREYQHVVKVGVNYRFGAY